MMGRRACLGNSRLDHPFDHLTKSFHFTSLSMRVEYPSSLQEKIMTKKKASQTKPTRTTSKSANRKMRAATTARSKAKAQKASKSAKANSKSKSVVSLNRSEGIRLFKLAGRPTKEQFVLVYGERGPKMTWEQRAAAGVPAKKFQAALAAKG
jgi:hypothetical protein